MLEETLRYTMISYSTLQSLAWLEILTHLINGASKGKKKHEPRKYRTRKRGVLYGIDPLEVFLSVVFCRQSVPRVQAGA